MQPPNTHLPRLHDFARMSGMSESLEGRSRVGGCLWWIKTSKSKPHVGVYQRMPKAITVEKLLLFAIDAFSRISGSRARGPHGSMWIVRFVLLFSGVNSVITTSRSRTSQSQQHLLLYLFDKGRCRMKRCAARRGMRCRGTGMSAK